MNYEEAIKTKDKYSHLIGNIYNSQEVSQIIIIPMDLGQPEIGVAAQKILRDGYYSPNPHYPDYELFVLYELESWLLSQPLRWSLLSDLLKKL
jgi:hypothetical protein